MVRKWKEARSSAAAVRAEGVSGTNREKENESLEAEKWHANGVTGEQGTNEIDSMNRLGKPKWWRILVCYEYGFGDCIAHHCVCVSLVHTRPCSPVVVIGFVLLFISPH